MIPKSTVPAKAWGVLLGYCSRRQCFQPASVQGAKSGRPSQIFWLAQSLFSALPKLTDTTG